MSLTEKIAYIKGVADGRKFDTSTPEGELIKLMLELLDDIAHEVSELNEQTETLNSYIEEIDEDLGYLEDVVYDDCDDFDDCDCCDGFECDGDCDDCDCESDCDECEMGEPYDFFKVVCPTCNEQVYLDNSLDPSKIICPSCHNAFSLAENN